MNNSYIKNILLREIIDYEELEKYLNDNFVIVMEEIFNLLDILINNYNKKSELKINSLLSFVENEIDIDVSNDKLDVIVINCLEFKNKNNLKNKNVMLKIDSILDNIYYECSNDYKFDMMRFLNYLLYKDKSINRLKIFLNGIDNSFMSSDYYDDIFVNLLYNFDMNDRDLKKYYYKVCIILLGKMNNNLLLKNRDRYLYILDNLKIHSEYTDDIYNLINDNNIDDNVLASRLGISFSFPYKYNFSEIIVYDDSIPNLKQPAVTIDKNNTIKMDDALYFKKNKDNTYTLYVHVSYVPAFVSYDSIVNEVSRDRYKSLYAFDKVIPILPNGLVFDKCSLVKNCYRNTVTFSLKLDECLRIIPDTFKISRTNVKVINNYYYDDANNIIDNRCNDDIGIMLRYLTIFTLNNIKNNNLDVERCIFDDDYYDKLLIDNKDINVSRDIICTVMKTINYNFAKYFRDRSIPCLYKYTFWNKIKSDDCIKEVNGNNSLLRYDRLVNDLNRSFFEIKLSSDARKFFNFDCYSSITDPLWKYSSMYNQFMIEQFIFNKNSSTDSYEEWYNITEALADELNVQKEENHDIQTVSKYLGRVRSRY